MPLVEDADRVGELRRRDAFFDRCGYPVLLALFDVFLWAFTFDEDSAFVWSARVPGNDVGDTTALTRSR
jgi:hypothetical protein